MTDRPILMSAPMVLASKREAEAPGTGKTQTRRILKVGADLAPDPSAWEAKLVDGVWRFLSDTPDLKGSIKAPVRFAIGDRLWVKETYRLGKGYDGVKPSAAPKFAKVWYEADIGNGAIPAASALIGEKRVSIHMPRAFSRLTLTVTDVRVERLQEISREDEIAEGTPEGMFFDALWSSIHGDESWTANPWIVAVTFRPELKNIDDATPSPGVQP